MSVLVTRHDESNRRSNRASVVTDRVRVMHSGVTGRRVRPGARCACDPIGPPKGDADDRLGRVFAARPYVTSVATSLLLLVIWDTGREVFESDDEHGWLSWVVIGFVVYALIVSFVVVPRSVAPKLLARGHAGRLFLFGLAVAIAPFLVGFASLTAGGDTWAMTLALVVAIALLFLNARTVAARTSTHV